MHKAVSSISLPLQHVFLCSFHVFGSRYFTTSSVKVTSAEDCSPAKGHRLPVSSRGKMLWKAPRNQVTLAKLVSFLPVLTVLATLTPQGLGLGVRKRQAVLLLGAVLLPATAAELALLSLRRRTVDGRVQIFEPCLIILISDQDQALGLYL